MLGSQIITKRIVENKDGILCIYFIGFTEKRPPRHEERESTRGSDKSLFVELE